MCCKQDPAVEGVHAQIMQWLLDHGLSNHVAR